jgi:hypothetical protein
MVRTTGFRIQDSGFRRLLWNLIPALPLCGLLVAGIIKAQMPANTPTFSVNAKWVTDRGSQVYNVQAYGAKCDGVTDDSAAFTATLAAIPSGAYPSGAGGTFFIPPSATPCVLSSARLAVTKSNVLVSGYGASLLCTVSDDCVTLGNLSNGSSNNNIFVKGLTIEPGTGSAGHSAIRDNAQGTHIEDVTFAGNGSNGFNHLIENDNDQSQVLDKIYSNGGGLVCNSTFCGSALWGPGPFSTNAGITFLSNFNLDFECSGNGVDWQSGNNLTLTNGIIQAYNQYAIRSNTSFVQNWVHEEVGGCTNPLGNVGVAGNIMEGAGVNAIGLAPAGRLASYVFTGTAGTTIYDYYIVAHHASYGASALLLSGMVTGAAATINSSNTVAVQWNAIPTASSYDVLRWNFTTGGQVAPYGAGNFAVATGLLASSVCSGGVCSFTDNVTTPSSYSVPIGAGNYTPNLPLWGTDLVLGNPSGNEENGFYVGNYRGPADITVASGCGGGCSTQHVTYDQGTGLTYSGSTIPYSPSNDLVLGGNYPYAPGVTALLLPAQIPYGSAAPTKGVINFGSPPPQGQGPKQLETWYDSNYAKTVSTLGHQPSADAGDSAVWQENAGGTQIAFQAASALSQYINHLPDGTSWLERQTSSLKTLLTPISFPSVTGSVNATQLSTPVNGTFTDTGTGGILQYNTSYCYRVAALDGLGTTLASTETCLTTANDSNNTHEITVTWGAVAGAVNGFKIYGRTTGAELLIASVSANILTYMDTGSVTPSGAIPTINTTGQVKPALYLTATNCSSSASPAVCGSAAAGSFVIGASTTSVVVDTTAVTANSQILLTEDSSLGTKLSVTCNTQSSLVLGTPKVTARNAGTSFTASIEVGPTTNPLCISYSIFN